MVADEPLCDQYYDNCKTCWSREKIFLYGTQKEMDYGIGDCKYDYILYHEWDKKERKYWIKKEND